MKFTPSQVIEMRQQADDAATAQIAQCEDKFHPDWREVADGLFATLAADRALEAAESALIAEQVEDTGEEGDVAYNLAIGHGIAAIRAMKEQA